MGSMGGRGMVGGGSTVETITLAPIIYLYCYFVHLIIFQ